MNYLEKAKIKNPKLRSSTAALFVEADEQIEQLKKDKENAFKKGFWAGYEDARCFPDESNILSRYDNLTNHKE